MKKNLMEATERFQSEMSNVEDAIARQMRMSAFRELSDDDLIELRMMIRVYDASMELVIAQSEAINEILERTRRWEENQD